MAGERVIRSLVRLFGTLRLRVHTSKSAVDRAWDRPFLGFAFWVAPKREVRVKVARKALVAMKDRVRSITKRTRGRSLSTVAQELRSYLLGWKGYFQLAATPRVFQRLDKWIRHRLRAYQLKQWKSGTTAFRELRSRGASVKLAGHIAANARRWWRNSAMKLHIVFPIAFFDRLGVPRLAT